MGINWDNFSKEVKSYQNKIRKNEMKISHLQHEINRFRSMEIDEKEKEIRIAELEIEVLGVEIASKIYRKGKEIAYFKNIDNSEIAQYKEIINHVTQYYCMQSKIEQLEKENKILVANVKLDKKTAKAEIAKVKEEIGLRQKKLVKIKSKIEQLKGKNEFLKNLLTVTFDDVEVLGEELKNKYIKEKINEIQNKKKSIKEKYQKLHTRLEKLKNAEKTVKSEIENRNIRKIEIIETYKNALEEAEKFEKIVKKINDKIQKNAKIKVIKEEIYEPKTNDIFVEIKYDSVQEEEKNKSQKMAYNVIENKIDYDSDLDLQKHQPKICEAAESITEINPQKQIIMMKPQSQINEETLYIASNWVTDMKNNMSFVNSFKKGEMLSEKIMNEITKNVKK